MAWFKVDDQLAFHQKTLIAGNEAMGLWVRAGAWASAQLTDGFVPHEIIQAMANEEVCHRLLMANLWTEENGGYQFHDWDEFQPSAEEERQKREDLKKARSEAGKAGAAARWGKEGDGKNGKTMASAMANAKASAMANEWQNDGPDPDPDPMSLSKDKDVSNSAEAEPRPDIESVLDRIDQHCADHDFKKPNRTKQNLNAARLMLDKDERTPDQINWIMDWVTAHHFWASNIMSASKLREKFDQLKGQALNNRQPAQHMTASQRRLQEGYEREQRILNGELSFDNTDNPYLQPRPPRQAIEGGSSWTNKQP